MANSVWIGYLGPTQVTSDGSGIVFPGTVTATRFLAGDGTAAAPAFQVGGTGRGLYSGGGDTIALALQSVGRIGFETTVMRFLSSMSLGWTASGSDPFGTTDTLLSRAATRALTLGPTTGVTLRYSTNGVLEVRNFANSAGGEIAALFHQAEPTGGFYWSTRAFLKSPGTALFNLTNSGETLGVGLDFATDAILKVRTRAQTGDASVTALNYTASGYVEGAEIAAPAAPAANGYRIFAQDNGAGKTQLMVLFASGAAQQIAIEP